MNIIDACGLSCPQPVLMAKKGLSETPDGISIKVDNSIAKENITRFATNLGYKVEAAEENGIFTLEITK